MIRRSTLFLSLFLAAVAVLASPQHSAQAAPVVADISNYRISVDAGFDGTRLFLFGVRNDNGDIVVVVRGPQRNVMVRKKEEVAGLWVNLDRMKFFQVPMFYAVASSKPLGDIEQHALFSQLAIGEEALIAPPSDTTDPARFKAFKDAFFAHQRVQRLYFTNPEPVSFMGETLFKTTIEFPDNIPPGEYTAEIYLLSDGEVTGVQSTPISVVKTGFEGAVNAMAHESPMRYGILAIAMALLAGWVAGRIFNSRN
jgi:uncharacterized protein (TIGR02186 family)